MPETLHLHTDGLQVAPLPNGKGIRLTDKAGNQVVIHGPARELLDAGLTTYLTAGGMARLEEDSRRHWWRRRRKETQQ